MQIEHRPGRALASFVLIASLLVATPVSAAPPPTDPGLRFHQYLRQHWSIEEGLPQIAVADMVQDERGFLWIGTQDGLARFDGIEFRVYRDEGRPDLPSDNISVLAFDAAGALWLGTRTGLARFRDGRFAAVSTAADEVGAVHDLEPVGDVVLVAADGGLFRVEGDSVHRVEDVPAERAGFVDLGPGDVVRVGLPGRVVELDADGVRTRAFPTEHASAMPQVRVASCGGEWIGTTTGLFRDTGDGIEPYDPVMRRNVSDLHCDDAGVLWVGTGSGLFRIRNGRVLEAVEDETVLPHPWVSSFLPGRDGALWIGTVTGGLYRLSAGRYVRYGPRDGLPFASVWAIAEHADGGLWVGGARGLVRFRDGRFETPPTDRSAPDVHVQTLVEDTAGILWIGTRSELLRFDPATGESERVMSDIVLGLAVDAGGTVWVGSLDGLHSIRDGVLQRHGEAEGIERVRMIVPSERHGLLVASDFGLFARGADGGFVRLDEGVVPGRGRVASVLETDDGDLWVGYLDDGLARYSAATGEWSRYTERDGLLASSVYRTVVGRDGWLWFASHKGVYRVRPDAFDRLDRLRTSAADSAVDRPRLERDVVVSVTGHEPGSSHGYCCNGGASAMAWLDEDGALWVATLQGIVRIETTGEPLAPAPSEAVIESIRYGDADRAPAQGLRIPAEHRDLEFVFTAPSFDKPERTRFQYRLDGYDADWHEVTGRRAVGYTNLPAGEYAFRVRAVTGDGASSTEEATLTFSIAPHFRETVWFYLIVAGLLLAAAALVHVARLRRFGRQQTRLEMLVAGRTAEIEAARAELERLNEQLRQQSHTDPLTGLWNRRYLADRIPGDVARLDRLRARPDGGDLCIAFFLIDIDRFKEINDALGHEAGDQVLIEIAHRLSALARASDYAVRWGGEEFLLVTSFIPAADVGRIAERIMEGLWGEPFPVAGHADGVEVRGSIGFSIFPFAARGALLAAPREGRAWQDIIRIADHALYHVKQTGRDGWAGLLPGLARDPSVPVREVADTIEQRIQSGEAELVTSRPKVRA